MERKRKREGGKREGKRERGRQNSSLPEFNIVYRARKDKARARERSMYPHVQL